MSTAPETETINQIDLSESDSETLLPPEPGQDIKKYVQNARDAWKTDPLFKDWLIIKNQKTVTCKFCHTLISAKHSTLISHSQSKKHIKAAAPFSLGRQPNIVLKKLKKLDEVHFAEARTALYIAKHSTMNSTDHLTLVNKANYSDSATCTNIKLARSKCSNVITNVRHTYFKSQLSIDIGSSPFSLIIDESTDTTVIKYLAVVVRFFNKTNS